MTHLFVVGADSRRDAVLDMLRDGDRQSGGQVCEFVACDSPAAAAAQADRLGSCDVLFLTGSAGVSTRTLESELVELRGLLPPTPVVAVPTIDRAATAFGLIRLGAFNVLAPALKGEFVWGAAVAAMGNLTPYPSGLLVPTARATAGGPWAFMSMDFDEYSPDGQAYANGVRPGLDALGLPPPACVRVDQTGVGSGQLDLRGRALEAIGERDVVFALYSSPDPVTPGNPNVVYEMAHAAAIGKSVLPIWRRSGSRLPVMTPRNVRVDFSTNTELALRLYFGLGGTHARLRPAPPGKGGP